jgi:hypothetical protein
VYDRAATRGVKSTSHKAGLSSRKTGFVTFGAATGVLRYAFKLSIRY